MDTARCMKLPVLSFAASELDLLLHRLSGMLLRCSCDVSGMECVRAGCMAAAADAAADRTAVDMAVDRRDDFDMRLRLHMQPVYFKHHHEMRRQMECWAIVAWLVITPT